LSVTYGDLLSDDAVTRNRKAVEVATQKPHVAAVAKLRVRSRHAHDPERLVARVPACAEPSPATRA